MKALITKTSDWKYKRKKEIKSLDDLAKLGKDESLIISFREHGDYDLVIEIYDTWRE